MNLSTILNILLPMVGLIAPSLSPVLKDVENAVKAGTLTFENAEALAEHLLVAGETYLPKQAQILADITNIIPQLAKLVTDIQNAPK